ncbi:MAG: hypothetical protein GDA54_00005, partial [Alphaproteobacteria bacterium GM7ARS4]|nr:hypothetical protein [Alphaproteobacteria bacterium GM7ARS4]
MELGVDNCLTHRNVDIVCMRGNQVVGAGGVFFKQSDAISGVRYIVATRDVGGNDPLGARRTGDDEGTSYIVGLNSAGEAETIDGVTVALLDSRNGRVLARLFGRCTGDDLVDRAGGSWRCISRATCAARNYRRVAGDCVRYQEDECASEQGFYQGKCVTPRLLAHCAIRGLVLNPGANRCDMGSSIRCPTGQLYHTARRQCVNARGDPMTCLSYGFGHSTGRGVAMCSAMPDAIQCDNSGGVLDSVSGSTTNGQCIIATTACTDVGYQAKDMRCVASVAGDCAGTQGFDNGKCVTPTLPLQCANRERTPSTFFVLNVTGNGCETHSACADAGYRIDNFACKAYEAGDCTGTQGFDNGRCVTPTLPTQCAHRERTASDVFFVLNMMGNGCQTNTSCANAGYRVDNFTCKASRAEDCLGSEGFNGVDKCLVAPSTVAHCTNRGAYILNVTQDGCVMSDNCGTGNVVNLAGDACIVRLTNADCDSRSGDMSTRVNHAGNNCEPHTIGPCDEGFTLNGARNACVAVAGLPMTCLTFGLGHPDGSGM